MKNANYLQEFFPQKVFKMSILHIHMPGDAFATGLLQFWQCSVGNRTKNGACLYKR